MSSEIGTSELKPYPQHVIDEWLSEHEIPGDMLQAAWHVHCGKSGKNTSMQQILAAALLWLAENPIEPSVQDAVHLMSEQAKHNGRVLKDSPFPEGQKRDYASLIAVEWQRIMFRKPKPELPAKVKALMWKRNSALSELDDETCDRHNDDLRKAYEFGLKARP